MFFYLPLSFTPLSRHHTFFHSCRLNVSTAIFTRTHVYARVKHLAQSVGKFMLYRRKSRGYVKGRDEGGIYEGWIPYDKKRETSVNSGDELYAQTSE
jgi:hypothetical protein